MLEIDWFWYFVLQGLAFYAGYRLGHHVAIVRVVKNLLTNQTNLDRFLKEYREIERQYEETQEETKPGRLHVERHGDHIYIYDQSNDEFLGQGPSLEEALDAIKRRFPDRNYSGLLTREQAEELGIKVK